MKSFKDFFVQKAAEHQERQEIVNAKKQVFGGDAGWKGHYRDGLELLKVHQKRKYTSTVKALTEITDRFHVHWDQMEIIPVENVSHQYDRNADERTTIRSHVFVNGVNQVGTPVVYRYKEAGSGSQRLIKIGAHGWRYLSTGDWVSEMRSDIRVKTR